MDKITKILLVVLSVAFAGWSASVWKAVDKIDSAVADLRLITQKIITVEKRLEEHGQQPWHSQAGEAIIRLQEQTMQRKGQ